ncbi:DUF3493 domain-containing protein [Synechococcus sp. BS55D]|uniref:DUF3493 domain-containing protein n=1 Tax=Synechococcus sp. BS55D TaxID=2055943 RepID=UPI00103A9525|nr:DUF3493 domain-containing protein [Synechococcus sp. BS55D]
MGQNSRTSLDPDLKERLLRESRTPWRGLRRLLWLAFFASGGLGLFVMGFRGSAGGDVGLSDLGIQIGAVVLFGSLLWFDRDRGV